MIDSTVTEEEVEYKGQGGFFLNMESDRQSEVRLQHTSVIRVELGSQERAREHIVVAMVTELGKQVLEVQRSLVMGDMLVPVMASSCSKKISISMV